MSSDIDDDSDNQLLLGTFQYYSFYYQWIGLGEHVQETLI